MKKILILIIILIFISGTPYIELNQLAIVDMIGIAYQDNQYILYITTLEAEKETDKTTTEHEVYQITGNSLGEVFEKAKLVNQKTTYYKHVSVLLLDEQLLKYNLSETITFLKNKLNQMNYILLSTDKVANIIKTYPNHTTIERFIKKEQNESGSIFPLTFDELYANYLDPLRQAYIPSITLNQTELQTNGIFQLNTNKKDENPQITYLLTNKIDSFHQPYIYQNKSYELVLTHLKSSIQYKNKNIFITISGWIDSDDIHSTKTKEIQQSFQNDVTKQIQEYIQSEQNNQITTTSLMNIIYLKERKEDKTITAFQNADIQIHWNIKWKGESNNAT